MILRRSGTRVSALIACLALSLAAALHARPDRPASPAGASEITRAGVAYTDARVFFGRRGFKFSWVVPQKRMAFTSGKTRIEIELNARAMDFAGWDVALGFAPVLWGGALYISVPDTEKVLGPLFNPRGSFPPSPPAPVVRVVTIDPGHGGKDTGTQNRALRLNEKTFTLKVGLRLRDLLVKRGYKVVMTRTDDRFIPLPDRAGIANRAGSDLFVSIHFNAASDPGVHGTEVFAISPRSMPSTSADPSENEKDPGSRLAYPGNKYDPWSEVLGFGIQRQLHFKLGSDDRGLRHARFAVLRLIDCPGVLVESGYLSNTAEANKIASPAYQQSIAEGIAAGIDSYALATNPPPRTKPAPKQAR